MQDDEFKAASRDGVGDDWPIAAADLAPAYARVEDFLGVRRVPLVAAERALKEAIERRWPARVVEETPWACREPARAHQAALRTGRVTLFADTIAERVLVGSGGKRVTGVGAVDRRTGNRHEIEGRAVVLCASALESTRLLLNSATSDHPNGLANSSGVLGRYLMDQAGDKPVLDLGCGDGAVAFFMESLGARVHAVDNAATNYNGMRGVRALKDSLGASLEIHEMDLDGRFALPDAQYGLAFFLGTLYHLKNPFYALEAVARKTRYCLLSTRVARFTPGGAVDFHDLPMAWLLDDREANADSTNYWIFSEAGLRRLLGRAGWNVLAWTTSGDTRLSEPSSETADERAFCLLEKAGALD
jgi:choline dehydrogenase-like flavoprotein